MSGCSCKSVMASALALMLSAGGLFAANLGFSPAQSAASERVYRQLEAADQAPARPEPVVLDQAYAAIEIPTIDATFGRSAFLQDLEAPYENVSHEGLDDLASLLDDDVPGSSSSDRIASAFLSRTTRQALAGGEQMPISAMGVRPAEPQTEIIPPPSALWSGIIMVAGVLIYRLHRKILYLS